MIINFVLTNAGENLYSLLNMSSPRAEFKHTFVLNLSVISPR